MAETDLKQQNRSASMADSTRPPAPFFPPEIISRVLHFIHPQSKDWSQYVGSHPKFAPLARISSEWKLEAQKRLFEAVSINSVTKLVNFLRTMASSGLGRFVFSLFISQEITDAHSLFLLLQQIPNIKYLNLSATARIAFSSEDTAVLRSTPPLLPNLITLEIGSYWSYGDGTKNLHRRLFDPLVATAPNLEELEFRSSSGNQTDEIWTSSIKNLKRLRLSYRVAVLEGSIWPISELTGLEELSVQEELRLEELRRILPTMKIIGPSLRKLDLKSQEIDDSFAEEFYSQFTVLEEITTRELLHSEDSLILPPSIVQITIVSFDGSPPPLSAWSNFKKLEKVGLDSLIEPYDVSTLPPLRLLTFSGGSRRKIMRSMESLVAGEVTIEEILLLDVMESFNEDEDAEIQEEMEEEGEDRDISEYECTYEDVEERCKELGIKCTIEGRY